MDFAAVADHRGSAVGQELRADELRARKALGVKLGETVVAADAGLDLQPRCAGDRNAAAAVSTANTAAPAKSIVNMRRI